MTWTRWLVSLAAGDARKQTAGLLGNERLLGPQDRRPLSGLGAGRSDLPLKQSTGGVRPKLDCFSRETLDPPVQSVEVRFGLRLHQDAAQDADRVGVRNERWVATA